MRIRVVMVAAIALAFQFAVVQAAQATTCSYRSAHKLVRATVSDFLSVVVTRSGDQIQLMIDNTLVPCGAATVTNTDKVVVTGTGGSSDTFFANFLGVGENVGRVGPGATPESSGQSEIEISFDVTPGNSPFPPQGPFPLYFQYVGSSGADRLTVGANGADLGGDGDVDVTSTHSFQGAWVFGVGGGDVMSLDGGGGSGAPFAFPSQMDGGNGKDRLTGGTSDDQITGGKGRDSLAGGLGNDSITANDGVADGVDGGDGDDTAYVDGGLDTVTNVEHVNSS
jgi:Ca2+-binding RTX toxin-like protein